MPIVHDDNPRATRNVGFVELDSNQNPGNQLNRARPVRRYWWHWATTNPHRRTGGRRDRLLPRYKLYLKDQATGGIAVVENSEINILGDDEYFLVRVTDVTAGATSGDDHTIDRSNVPTLNNLAIIPVITSYEFRTQRP